MIDSILRQHITDYLEKTHLMQVATSHNNQPWVCSVYFAYDEMLNLYWISAPTRRHSEEIRMNEKVAGSIVYSHNPGDKVRGIQFQGKAYELKEKEKASPGLQLYAKRYGMNEARINLILEGTDGHILYKIMPSVFVLFDEVNYPENPRQEYLLT